MPVFGFDRTFGLARNLKAFLNPEGGIARGEVPDAEEHEGQAEDPRNARQRPSEHEKRIESKRRELAQAKNRLHAAKDEAERTEYQRRTKRAQVELSQLQREPRGAGEPETGALPDFVVIGAAKSGTTFFYHLLSQHPHVQPAVVKEPHYFNVLFEEGTEWYRRCFPQPRKDGRRTITGEASPGYIWHPLAPERMAEVIPQARLIALLRNPPDRIYSDYHQRVKNGRVTRTFEEIVQVAFDDPLHGHLSKSIYVDHLQRWSEFFPREQMLVLKSEDFFERPVETLKVAMEFLDLPEWEPEASELGDKRNKGKYEQRMDPATRRRLEEYFEPHNQRLYDYLGVDFGW